MLLAAGKCIRSHVSLQAEKATIYASLLVSCHSVARQCLHCCKDDHLSLENRKTESNSETPETIHPKFGMDDYVGDIIPHAKIQTDRDGGATMR